MLPVGPALQNPVANQESVEQLASIPLSASIATIRLNLGQLYSALCLVQFSARLASVEIADRRVSVAHL